MYDEILNQSITRDVDAKQIKCAFHYIIKDIILSYFIGYQLT